MSTYSNAAMSSHAGPIQPIDETAPITAMMGRIRSMIERNAPRLMRAGGGPLIGEKAFKPLSAEQKAHVVELAKMGLPYRMIAERMATSRENVSIIARKAGVFSSRNHKKP